ncbi:MAG: DUF4476 domain-containing protein [Bacteroidetes bacterium]|nr:DUF4476 domain-containing protein [Bacteroidota bacterium]
MRIFLLVLLLFCSTYFLSAQRSNFAYIQSEPAQLFSVIINADTISSSKSGYLILSKLTDTAYQITISFPGQNWPAQYFTLDVFQSDRGYLLKDYGEKGWGLLDWRSLLIQYGKKRNPLAETRAKSTTMPDEFSALLAMAAGDASLHAREEAKQPAIVPAQPKDTTTVIPESQVITNPRCSVIATPQQLNQLLATMNTLTGDLKRVLLISKSLQKYCLTVSQAAVLIEKFDTDQGRYDFLLEAWLYVSDRSRFADLYVVFKNPEFVIRLKEMLQ